MRILQAIETGGPGGAEQVLVRLCTSLRSSGHDVRVAMLRGGWLAQRLADEGIDIDWLTLRGPLDRAFFKALRTLALAHRVDVIHAHEFTFSFYSRLAAARHPIAVLATAHGANFARGPKRRLAAALTLRPATRFALVAVSRALARHLERSLLLQPGRVSVVRNGIDIPPPPALPRTRGSTCRLLAVGNLYAVKNHSMLIRVVARLRARGVPAELDILGRGAEEEALRRQVAALNLQGHVRVRGYRPDVPSFLEAADIFVSSSLSEQMPLSFLEAMARGVPIVASRVGGVSEIVEHEADGLLFASGDEATAAALIERLWQSPAVRRALADRAREKVETQYSVEAMTSAYLQLYEHLARR